VLPNLDAFSALPPGVDVQLTCTIFGYEERPYLFLSRGSVKRLARIGATLDVDTYDLTSVSKNANCVDEPGSSKRE